MTLADVVTALSIALVAFCLPAISELSSARVGQVGVDKRDNENKKNLPSNAAGSKKPVKRPVGRQRINTLGILILHADLDCRISIDGQFVGFLDKAEIKQLRVNAGGHIVKATSLDGSYLWTKTVQVPGSQKVTISIGLKEKKAEAEEAARLERARLENERKKAEGAGAGPSGLLLRLHEFDIVTVNSSGQETSRRKGRAQFYNENFGGMALELVVIQGGSFTMGYSSGEPFRYDAEGPQHQVTVQPFYMGKYEVTQAQWRTVASLPRVARDLNSDPSHFKDDNLPVEQVSWEEAVEFCERMSRATGRSYRLPTEAEWEYACRAGTTSPFAFGQTVTPQLVNYDGNYPYAQASKGTFREKTTSVGFMGVANGFGLFDMHGNVWEWCLDYWHENYNGAPTDGRSWETAGETRYRVLRGGSWVNYGNGCRSAYRVRFAPANRGLNVGFRVVSVGRTP